MELAYSGLHQLCAPMLDHLDRLPVPQRDALATVFGLSSGPATRPPHGGTGHADAGRGRRRAAAADLLRRRRAVAGPGVRADPRVRRPPSARRARRVRVRGTHGDRGRRPRRAARAADRWTRRQRCAHAAAGQRARPAGRGRLRPDHRGEPRQPARAPRATAHVDVRESRGRIRAARQPTGGRQDRAELRPASPAAALRHPAARPRRGRGASRRPHAAARCGPGARRRHGGVRPRGGRRAASRRADVSSSPTRSSDPPPTARPPQPTATGCIVLSPTPPMPRRTRIGAPGTAPALRRDRTRTSRPSSSARPAAHSHAEGSRPPPPF